MVEFLSRDYIVHRMISPSDSQEKNSPISGEEAALKPRFSIRKERGRIVIQFVKSNPYKIRILSKRGSEESFSLLAEIDGTQHIDSRPNLFEAPEIREYIAYYLNGEKIIGQASDVVLIIHNK